MARRSYILRIASTPTCYLWTGIGDLETPPDKVDPLGARWLGSGGILTIPALKSIINGVAERVEFVLSGVTAETLRLARSDLPTIRMAECRIGYVEFDEAWQLVGAIRWEWIGLADALRVQSRSGAESRNRTISLMVGSADTFRANPNFTYWTDASQRIRSADDAFCDHVAAISYSVTRRFGPR
ncbi:hypothetical protein [Novosphingobium sp. HII-3]|uniref:hypothetical protein n=1 Tax=Novosphingobium sp. HII-3 TaxID=2075565 RepID=UPI000CDAC338|nr:hypothetical protein [Novosphingobium sp. HII-3]